MNVNRVEPLLTGPRRLVDAPLTIEDWRQIYWAYRGFMMQVRTIVREAWGRERQQGGQDA